MVTGKQQAIMQLVVDNPFNGDFYHTELELPATKAEIKGNKEHSLCPALAGRIGGTGKFVCPVSAGKNNALWK